MVWEPKTCCGCCKPKVGALILGYGGLVMCVFSLFGIIKGALKNAAQIEEICLGLQGLMTTSACYGTVLSSSIISAIMEVIRGGMCLMLIFGIKKNNQCLMLPYMIFQVIGIVLLGLVFLALTIFVAVFKLWLFAFIFFLIGAAIDFFMTYCFLVVRVCYKEAKEENRMKDNEIEVAYIQPQQGRPQSAGFVYQQPPPPFHKT